MYEIFVLTDTDTDTDTDRQTDRQTDKKTDKIHNRQIKDGQQMGRCQCWQYIPLSQNLIPSTNNNHAPVTNRSRCSTKIILEPNSARHNLQSNKTLVLRTLTPSSSQFTNTKPHTHRQGLTILSLTFNSKPSVLSD